MKFRGLVARTSWLMLALLGLANVALAQLPPLKLPVASYYAERSLGGFLSGGKFVSNPEDLGYWTYKYKSYVLGEDYLLQAPTAFQFSSTYGQVFMPLPGGKMLRALSVASSTLRITTHEAGSETVLTTHDISSSYPNELMAACGDYALVYKSYLRKVILVPLAEGQSPVELDLSSVLGAQDSMRKMVAGGAWFAIGYYVQGSWDRLDWRVYRTSDFEPMGSFFSNNASSISSVFALEDRYIAISDAAQIQLWDTENLNVAAKTITAVQAGNARFEEVVGDGASLWAVVGVGNSGGRAARRVSQLVRNATSGDLEVGYQAELDIPQWPYADLGLAAEGSIALFRNSATGATQVYDSRAIQPVVEMVPGEPAAESSGKASFLVSLDEPAQEACSVRVVARSGTATAGADFVARDFRLEFAPGERAKQVDITLLSDVLPENHESILVDLLEPEGLVVRPTEDSRLVIRASGFQLDQQVFAGLPEGWGKHDVLAVLTNYLIARVQRQSPGNPNQTEYKIAAFDLKNGGFVSFADFDTNQKKGWSEADGLVGYLFTRNFLNDSTLYRWNPHNGGTFETREYNHSGYGETFTPIWAGGNRVAVVKRNDYDLSAAPGGLGLFTLAGTKVDGVNPNQCEFALSDKYLAVVAYYYGNSSSDYWKANRLWLHVYDRATLARLWSQEVVPTNNNQFSVQISNELVLVSNDRLRAYGATTGNLLWSRKPSAGSGTGNGDYPAGLRAIGPKHAFIQRGGAYYTSIEVVELETGAYLGPLEVGDLFSPASTVESILGSGSGVFVERDSRNMGGSELMGNTWVELKAERTRPAVIMDPAVLALANGGVPVSFHLAENYSGPVEVQLSSTVKTNGGSYSSAFANSALSLPGDGSAVTAWMDLPPELVGWNLAALSGSILVDGHPLAQNYAFLPAVVGVNSLADHQTQLATGFDFAQASVMKVGDGMIFVGYPYFSGGSNPGNGKVEVFNAVTGAHLRTIQRPASPASYLFGTTLHYRDGKLLVGAPGVPPGYDTKPKSGSVHIYEAATGQMLATILNPTPGSCFGSELASSPDYFAVSAVNSRLMDAKGRGSVTVFRWSDYKRAFSKTGDPLMGTSLAFTGNELLVGTPGATVKKGRYLVTQAGRVQRFELPKGKEGAAWYSPWLVEKGFGMKVLCDGGPAVVGSAEPFTWYPEANFQVFDGPGAAPRFMFKNGGGFRASDASLQQGLLAIASAGYVALVSPTDGAVPMESSFSVSVAANCYALDSNSNLFWLGDGKLFRADKADLGGFAWWAHASMPGSGAADPAADANGNRQPDLVDYVTDRAGMSPVSVSVSNEMLAANVNSAVPRDVCVRIEVQDFAGGWQVIGSWAGGLWLRGDLSQGVPVERTWAQPQQYRVVYTWLGREE